MVGCEPQRTSGTPVSRSGGVAVIDLDEVAKRLGRDQVILSELKSTSDALTEKLTTAQKDLQNKFNTERQTIGATPTDSDKQKLLQTERSLNLEFQQKQQEAQNELNAKRAAVVTRFREEVKPVAREIANGKGLDVILIKSDAVIFSAETGVDITDAVVAKMISSAPAGTVPSPAASSTP